MIKLIDFKDIILLFSCIFSVFILNAQIVANDNNDNQGDTLGVIDKKTLNTSDSEVYFGVFTGRTDRVLKVNEGLFAGDINTRNGEESVIMSSFFIGFRSLIAKRMSLDIGFGFTRNGEVFSIDEPDSLLEYENTYRHLAFPLQLAYTSGEKDGPLLSIGVVPKAFLSKKIDLRFRDANESIREEEIIEKDGLESFYIDLTAAAGWRLKLSDSYGIYVLGRGMYQLTNNYDKQSPFIRNPWAIGIHFGIQVYI